MKIQIQTSPGQMEEAEIVNRFTHDGVEYLNVVTYDQFGRPTMRVIKAPKNAQA